MNVPMFTRIIYACEQTITTTFTYHQTFTMTHIRSAAVVYIDTIFIESSGLMLILIIQCE